MHPFLSSTTALACLLLSLEVGNAQGSGTTELGKLSAGMKPGAWAELKTDGYTAELLKAQNHHILEYTGAATRINSGIS